VPAVEDGQVWSYAQELEAGKRAYSFPIAAPVEEVGVGLKSSPNCVVNWTLGVGDASKLMKMKPWAVTWCIHVRCEDRLLVGTSFLESIVFPEVFRSRTYQP
jgi:hypothetical protein